MTFAIGKQILHKTSPPSIIPPLFKIYLNYVCACVFVCGVVHMSLHTPEEAKGIRSPWSWSYRWLSAVQCGYWELNLAPVLNLGDISPGLRFFNF